MRRSFSLLARCLPGDGGHEPLGGIAVAPTPISHAPGVILAAIGSLAFGAVLGPEAPLFALGSIVGLVACALRKDGGHGRKGALDRRDVLCDLGAVRRACLLPPCFLLEAGVGMGAMAHPDLHPGPRRGLDRVPDLPRDRRLGRAEATTLSVPGLPVYDGVHLRDLVVAVGGSVCCLPCSPKSSGGWRRESQALGGRGSEWRGHCCWGRWPSAWWRWFADGLGASSQDVLFSGQASIPSLVGEDSARIVIVLLAAKALAYAVCLGCGFRGGPVFPAIFLGVAVAMVAAIAFDMSPTLALAVGTTRAKPPMTAMTRLILASLIIAALLVGTAGVEAVPVAALAAVAAWMTMAAIDTRFPVRSAA